MKQDGKEQPVVSFINWDKYKLSPLDLKWSLHETDLNFSTPIGINLLNNVIAKRYESTLDLNVDELSTEHDQCFLVMVARDGSWRVNTLVKGFAHGVGGFASSYSGPGDILLIGKNKKDMQLAFERMQAIGGGIVLVENSEILHEVPLPLIGRMSNVDMAQLIQIEKKMIALLKERGYRYDDPAFTLFFFSATHLPFIRLTPSGLYDVKNKEVLVPPMKR